MNAVALGFVASDMTSKLGGYIENKILGTIPLVLLGVFKIFQDLYGLRFEEIADSIAWHYDVNVYSVSDLCVCELFGYWLEGKYGHACVVPLQCGSSHDDARQIPVALLTSQFQKYVDGGSGLLRFSKVVGLFHEFGHVVYHICIRAMFSKFFGPCLAPTLYKFLHRFWKTGVVIT
ncbi:Neurolysin [Heracleum sosnowskyi]|uniref:Neurolysin n=1 Tax=Heracleum sosnowskyi TaxID=360622 RepID=A0AAD8I9V5_9APIA|nr:Neurolysin [Heracleum sosnowskyi]